MGNSELKEIDAESKMESERENQCSQRRTVVEEMNEKSCDIPSFFEASDESFL